MQPRFPSHGDARFEIHEGIVRLQVRGPWNAELVHEVHQALQAALQQLGPQPWGMLVLVSGSALFGPEAMEAIRRAAQQEAETTGRLGTAWVLPPEVEGASLMRGLVERLYCGSNRVRVFERADEAQAWLREILPAAPG